jgi:hypothetical protein
VFARDQLGDRNPRKQAPALLPPVDVSGRPPAMIGPFTVFVARTAASSVKTIVAVTSSGSGVGIVRRWSGCAVVTSQENGDCGHGECMRVHWFQLLAPDSTASSGIV